MTITIELAPELQAELPRRPARQGVGLDAYAASSIEDAFSRSGCGADRRQSSTRSRDVVEAIETLKGFWKDPWSFALRYDDP